MAKVLKKGKLDRITVFSSALMNGRREVYLVDKDITGIWITDEVPKKGVKATFIPFTNISHIVDIIDDVVEAVK